MIPTRPLEDTLRYKADRMLRQAVRGGSLVDMASPPTITLSAGNVATTLSGTTQQILTPSTTFTDGVLRSAVGVSSVGWSYFTNAAQDLYFPAAVEGASGARRGSMIAYVFATDAPAIELLVLASASNSNEYRLWINDKPVTAAVQTITADSTFRRLKIDNGSTPIGKITFETGFYVSFCGVAVGANYSVWPVRTDGPRLMVVGDSVTVGTGAPKLGGGFAHQVGQRLGIADTWVNGESGIGYRKTGQQSGKTPLQKLGADVAAYAPDWVVVALGINDADQVAADVQADATAYLAALLEALPFAGVTVMGPWTGPALVTPDPIFAAIAAAVAAQGEAVGSGRIRYIDTKAGNWQWGTGRTGATSGTGNSNIYISSDGIHPTQAGHDYLAMRTAQAVTRHLIDVTA